METDFLPLGIGNSDVILGVHWLELLGTLVSDWKTQKMSFVVDRIPIKLKGDPSLARSKISLKAMCQCYVVCARKVVGYGWNVIRL